MKSNNFKNRLTALALCFTLLLGAAPITRAYAVNDESDTSSSQSDSDSTDTSSTDSDSADTSSTDSGSTDSADSKDSKDATADNDKDVTAAASEAPAVTATAALLISPDSDMVLYEKNADEKRYPASTTKIMTALLTLENVEDLNETVTAEQGDFAKVTSDSSNAGIKVGETVRVIDLLYALMLPSANEAAYILARHVGGTSEHFVDMMNTRAEELGCTGTHFCNPCGLHEEDHYTTARDLYLIAREAMKNDTFTNIIDTVQYRMPKTNMHEERIIFTTNQLIFSSFNPWSYPYNKGIKTGHTSQAGNCFVGYAEYGDAKLYSVVLGSAASSKEYPTVAASFTDTKSLYQWGFTHFKTKTVAKKGDTLAHVKVDLSTQTDQLVLTAKTDLVALLPADVETDSLEATPNLPEAVDAPIKAGDVVGSMTYSYNGTSYGTVELVALSDVEMSRVLYYSDKLSHFFQSTVFKIVLIAAAIFIVLYILFNITFGGIRRRRRRKAMRKRYDNDDYPRRHRR